MAAVQGVTVSADLPGTVARMAFESGRPVREGDVLAELDTRQERAQLAAIEAQQRTGPSQLQPDEGSARRPGDLAGGVRSRGGGSEADGRAGRRDARDHRAQDDPRAVRGVLGIRQVNLGQYLAAGDAVVPLQSLNPIYVNFGVPQQDIGQIRVGPSRPDHRTRRRRSGLQRARHGVRLDRRRGHRNVQVQATLANTLAASCGPACSSRPSSMLGASHRSSRCPHRRSVTPPSATLCSW